MHTSLRGNSDPGTRSSNNNAVTIWRQSISVSKLRHRIASILFHFLLSVIISPSSSLFLCKNDIFFSLFLSLSSSFFLPLRLSFFLSISVPLVCLFILFACLSLSLYLFSLPPCLSLSLSVSNFSCLAFLLCTLFSPLLPLLSVFSCPSSCSSAPSASHLLSFALFLSFLCKGTRALRAQVGHRGGRCMKVTRVKRNCLICGLQSMRLALIKNLMGSSPEFCPDIYIGFKGLQEDKHASRGERKEEVMPIA